MTTSDIIASCSEDKRRPFLVIGGLAVAAHGYPRDTVDLDYLVRASDREAWREVLAQQGYEPVHEHDHFAQFASNAGWIDLDLMFVNERTFDAMFAASELKCLGHTMARFPSLEHLVALKLHVIKQNLAHRVLGDTNDIINLILANRLNVREEKWRELFAKHGSLETYERILRATAL